jgi:hypothetical protein
MLGGFGQSVSDDWYYSDEDEELRYAKHRSHMETIARQQKMKKMSNVLILKKEVSVSVEEEVNREENEKDIELIKPYLTWKSSSSSQPNVIDDPEFPALGSIVNSLKRTKMPKQVEKNNEEGWKKIETKREKRVEQTVSKNRGEKGVKESYNDEERDGKKTSVCHVFAKYGNCSKGKKCLYAHRKEDLVMPECQFAKRGRCRFVVLEQETGVYYNSTKTRQCPCRHRNESDDNVFKRLTQREQMTIEETMK